jgi:hypothetical protein
VSDSSGCDQRRFCARAARLRRALTRPRSRQRWSCLRSAKVRARGREAVFLFMPLLANVTSYANICVIGRRFLKPPLD